MTNPTARPLIVIDPGHGKPDPGAQKTLGRLVLTTEAEQNLAVALTLKAELLATGLFDVMLTRSGAEQPGGAALDRASSFARRTGLAAFRRAFAYISVHHDTAKVTPHNARGGVYYHPGRLDSQNLAISITNLTGGWCLPDTTARQGQLWVVRNSPAQAGVLWEVGPLKIHTKATRLKAVQPIVFTLKLMATSAIAARNRAGDRRMS